MIYIEYYNVNVSFSDTEALELMTLAKVDRTGWDGNTAVHFFLDQDYYLIQYYAMQEDAGYIIFKVEKIALNQSGLESLIAYVSPQIFQGTEYQEMVEASHKLLEQTKRNFIKAGMYKIFN